MPKYFHFHHFQSRVYEKSHPKLGSREALGSREHQIQVGILEKMMKGIVKEYGPAPVELCQTTCVQENGESSRTPNICHIPQYTPYTYHLQETHPNAS